MKPTRYIKIQQTLEERIKNETYPVDSKLPTEERLAREFEVNRHTIRRALKHLLNLRYIKRAPRIGSVVISRTPTFPADEKVTVKYVYFADDPASDSDRKRLFSEICATFANENPGIDVVLHPIKRLGLLFSPHLPTHDDSDAVLVARVDYLSDYARRGVFLPLDTFEDSSDIMGNLEKRLLRLTKDADGKECLHALPIQTTTWMMAVNFSLFAQLGFSESDIPRTWDEFFEICAKIAKMGEKSGILPFEPMLHHSTSQSMTRYLPYLYSAGREGLLSETEMGLKINTKPTMRFLNWISKMYHLIPKAAPRSQFFINQKAVFRFSVATGFIDGMRKDNAFPIRLAPIPTCEPDSQPTAVMNAVFAGIIAPSANSTRKKNAAWKFLKYLTSEPVQLKLYNELSDLPTRPDMRPDVLASESESALSYDMALKYGNMVYDYPYNTDIHRIVLQAFSNVATGVSTPENAIAGAQFMLDQYTFDKNTSDLQHHPQEAL